MITERQTAVITKLQTVLGDQAIDPEERATRALEEMIELAHCLHVERAVAEKLVAHAYSKPPGQVSIEMGQAGLTFEALATVLHFNIDSAIQDEWGCLSRIAPEALQAAAKRKADMGVAHRRMAGRTSDQITTAPENAVYVADGPRSRAYAIALAQRLERRDLTVIAPEDLEREPHSFVGRPIILDHYAALTGRQWAVYQQLTRDRHPA